MGRKNQIPEFYSIKEGDLSGNLTGSQSVVGQTDRATYIADVSGTDIDGSLKIEISKDGTIWDVLPIDPPILLSNLNTQAIVSISDITWNLMRPVYTDTSGATAIGTLNVRMTASTEGA
jgi:hypothetical protein